MKLAIAIVMICACCACGSGAPGECDTGWMPGECDPLAEQATRCDGDDVVWCCNSVEMGCEPGWESRFSCLAWCAYEKHTGPDDIAVSKCTSGPGGEPGMPIDYWVTCVCELR